MKIKESEYRASQKYIREKCRNITMMLNRTLDEDILTWLDSQSNKQGYLKELIRADMAKHGFTPKKEENEETN